MTYQSYYPGQALVYYATRTYPAPEAGTGNLFFGCDALSSREVIHHQVIHPGSATMETIGKNNVYYQLQHVHGKLSEQEVFGTEAEMLDYVLRQKSEYPGLDLRRVDYYIKGKRNDPMCAMVEAIKETSDQQMAQLMELKEALKKDYGSQK